MPYTYVWTYSRKRFIIASVYVTQFVFTQHYHIILFQVQENPQLAANDLKTPLPKPGKWEHYLYFGLPDPKSKVKAHVAINFKAATETLYAIK